MNDTQERTASCPQLAAATHADVPLRVGTTRGPLKAPFPWFGGKSRVAGLVWDRFGDVPNYVEPFAGSLAVLLARPTEPGIETANDIDCFLSNFWRATAAVPDDVARHCDWPINEADLHARHRRLVDRAEFREKMRTDPDYFDAKIAGWWVWGLCQWIGAGWCQVKDQRMPRMHGSDRGIFKQEFKRPHLNGRGGQGVHRTDQTRPQIESGGRGVNAKRLSQQLPALKNGWPGGVQAVELTESPGALYDYFRKLQARLRRVRVCCGHWDRILGPSPTWKTGLTGVFLDPPYSHEHRDNDLYTEDSADISAAVRDWAIKHGDNKLLRIALCGYEGEHEMPSDWAKVCWKTAGGYASQAGNTENSFRERIWFSPHCLQAKQIEMFETL